MERMERAYEERLFQCRLELGVDGANDDRAILHERKGAQGGQKREEGEALSGRKWTGSA